MYLTVQGHSLHRILQPYKISKCHSLAIVCGVSLPWCKDQQPTRDTACRRARSPMISSAHVSSADLNSIRRKPRPLCHLACFCSRGHQSRYHAIQTPVLHTSPCVLDRSEPARDWNPYQSSLAFYLIRSTYLPSRRKFGLYGTNF